MSYHTVTMKVVAEMIARNVGNVKDPEEVILMTQYITYVMALCRPTINKAKQWHDHIFRPRYYYTTCSDTLTILSHLHTKEMARHVIPIQSAVVPFSSLYLLDVEAIVRRILDAGLSVVYYVNDDAFLMDTPQDVFKATSIEIIMEGTPFEQEYVTQFMEFHEWLDHRLPRSTVCR